MAVPKFDDLFNPLLQALRELGGSGSIAEIDEKVGEILHLSEADLNESHKGSLSRLSYRLAWARNYLKRFGLLENSARGVWALTQWGNEIKTVDKEKVKKSIRQASRKVRSIEGEVREGDEPEEEEEIWRTTLLEELLRLSPAAFEKLSQRLLRESGFTQVEVSGRSGDGGIDGRGIVRLGGLLSVPVIFQCKRYQGTVGSQIVRDFRGAMIGRADKGIIITTGTFTRDARQEAIRDGAPQIDLIDGDDLIERLKNLRLGVKVRTEEVIEVDSEWFAAMMKS